MAGFKVPADLADLPLTLVQVQEVLDLRRKRKQVQARLDALPDRAEEYRKTIADLEQEEKDLLASAKGEEPEEDGEQDDKQQEEWPD